ncbi:unnamed protein product [Rotaria sordida]|uniref:F-box domain-containing protein n=2 Tax=Rotaria sordida TaxID=392033 RepID=A0A814PGX4_9BILA|nr:unnamed protein product [Rotaria sordida]
MFIKTIIEDLPTELWLDIFTYLNIKEQFNGFFNLNQRINQFLLNYYYHVNLKNNDENSQYLFEYILSQLPHLESISNLRLENINKVNVCQEKNSIEDNLRAKFEHEIKLKLDDLRRTFEKEYNDKILYYKNNYEQDNQIFKTKYNQDLEQQSKEFNQDIERMKINHEKMINELNIELDRLRANDDAKNRLIYVEKEFEQLKHDYSDLNLKQKELINTCKTLEDENQNLLQTIEQLDHEKFQLKENFEKTEEKLSNEIIQLNELIEKQKQELNYSSKQTDDVHIDLKQNLESLQTRIHNYENAVSQYEEYRLKLENNLQKITQQRDTNKMDLRLTKEILINKENEFNQMKLNFDEIEKTLQIYKERSLQHETTINNLQKQIQQYEQQILDLNQTKLQDIQMNLFQNVKRLHFPCLKSLTLCRLYITNDILDLIHFYAPYLEYLNVSLLISSKWNILIKLILSLPKLHRCYLNLGIGLCPIKSLISSISPIKYLTLLGSNQFCSMKNLVALFYYLPYLHSLYIECDQLKFNEIIQDQYSNKLLSLSNFSLQINHLPELFINLIDFITITMPYIEKLKIKCCNPLKNLVYINIYQWIKAIDLLIHLKELILIITPEKTIKKQAWNRRIEQLIQFTNMRHITLQIISSTETLKK